MDSIRGSCRAGPGLQSRSPELLDYYFCNIPLYFNLNVGIVGYFLLFTNYLASSDLTLQRL